MPDTKLKANILTKRRGAARRLPLRDVAEFRALQVRLRVGVVVFLDVYLQAATLRVRHHDPLV